MYLRRSRRDVRAFRLVLCLCKIEGAADSFDVRRAGGTNVGVAVSSFEPPGAAVGGATGGCFII